MIRAFVGLDLPDPVKNRLAGLQSGVPGARWSDPAGLHLTLRFLGEIPEPALDDVHDVLSGLNAPAFELTLDGVGVFAQGARPRVLWVGVQRNEALSHLQQKVEAAMVRAGHPPEERRFTPHVTLARFGGGGSGRGEGRGGGPGDRLRRYLEANALVRIGPIPIADIVLFESRMGGGGSVYVPLETYPLGD